MKLTVYTVTEVTFHGMDISIPKEVEKEGEKAIVEWMNKNITKVDFAPTKSTETNMILKVTGIEIPR